MNHWRTLKTSWHNFLEVTPVLFILVVVALLLGLGLVPSLSSTWEQTIRYWGLCLELAGLAVIGIGLRDTRLELDQKTTWAKIKEWFAKIPPQNYKLQAERAEFRVEFGEPRLRQSAPRYASLYRRVEVLEQGYIPLFNEVGVLREAIKTLENGLKAEHQDA